VWLGGKTKQSVSGWSTPGVGLSRLALGEFNLETQRAVPTSSYSLWVETKTKCVPEVHLELVYLDWHWGVIWNHTELPSLTFNLTQLWG